ncbi:hypothetical protein [Nitrospira sp. CMX1]
MPICICHGAQPLIETTGDQTTMWGHQTENLAERQREGTDLRNDHF